MALDLLPKSRQTLGSQESTHGEWSADQTYFLRLLASPPDVDDTMDETWGHYGKWDKSDRERQIQCDLSDVWHLKKLKQETAEWCLPEAEGWWEKWEEIGQRVQTSGQKLNKFWESDEQDGNYG